MYKKIKNGSFMNWIWFIIALIPIFLLMVYSSNYLFNKSTNSIDINNLINWQKDKRTEEQFENNYLMYELYVGDETATIDFNNNRLNILNFRSDFMDPDLLSVAAIEDNYKGVAYVYIEFYTINENTNIEIIYNSTSGTKSELIEKNIISKYIMFYDSDTDFFEFNLLNTSQEREEVNIGLSIFVTFKDISTDLIINQDNWYNVIINNTYLDYLYTINSTIQTNGFISNAFLNLSQYFGITNVYYSIACYYIEYLLVIILLHLAFDILYIVPNICHKFMEKIGGERD